MIGVASRCPVDSLGPACCSVVRESRRGYGALDQLEERLGKTRFLLGEGISLADIALLAYTRTAHQGGFDLDRYGQVRRWIGEVELRLGLSPVR